MRSALIALLLSGILLAVTARNAAADTFDMTWAGGYGPGSAILTATNEGGGNYLVTGVTGTQNGVTISGVASYAQSDNLIFPAGTALLDFYGLSFAAGPNDYNIFSNGLPITYDECSSALACITGPQNTSLALTSLSITPVTNTPEPGTLIFLLLGTIGVIAVSLGRRCLPSRAGV
jgi:hypothetical protein